LHYILFLSFFHLVFLSFTLYFRDGSGFCGLPFERVPVTVAEAADLAEAITPDGDLRTLPGFWSDEGGLGGFFAARLRRA
jgi:hypothetical protein